jgi:hypothetical protein
MRRANAFGHQDDPLARPAAAFLVGGLAVLVVHQPVVGLLHALGSTPITPYNLRATQPCGIPAFLSLTLGRRLDDPDRLYIGSPAARMGLLDRCSLSGRTAPDIDDLVRLFPLKGLSPSDAAASVGAVNALIVNGLWGLAFAFAWSRIFAVPALTATTAVERSRIPKGFAIRQSSSRPRRAGSRVFSFFSGERSESVSKNSRRQ